MLEHYLWNPFKMRTLFYLGIGFVILTLVYNFIFFDYGAGLFDSHNLPYIIGIGAGICAFILLIILINYQELRQNSIRKSTEEPTSQSSSNSESGD